MDYKIMDWDELISENKMFCDELIFKGSKISLRIHLGMDTQFLPN